jgi:hypothetical protein
VNEDLINRDAYRNTNKCEQYTIGKIRAVAFRQNSLAFCPGFRVLVETSEGLLEEFDISEIRTRPWPKVEPQMVTQGPYR